MPEEEGEALVVHQLVQSLAPFDSVVEVLGLDQMGFFLNEVHYLMKEEDLMAHFEAFLALEV